MIGFVSRKSKSLWSRDQKAKHFKMNSSYVYQHWPRKFHHQSLLCKQICTFYHEQIHWAAKMKKDPNTNDMKAWHFTKFCAKGEFWVSNANRMCKIYLLTSTGTKYFQQFILSGQTIELHNFVVVITSTPLLLPTSCYMYVKILLPNMKFYCFFQRVANVLWNCLVLCKQLPTFVASGFTSCMVSVNSQNFSINKNFWNYCFTCEKATLAISFASLRHFDFTKCQDQGPRLQSVLTASARCLDSTMSHTKKLFFHSHKGKIGNFHIWIFLVVISVICNCNQIKKGGKFLKN